MTAPTAADIARIAAHGDSVVRNLLITHCYHELSRAVRDVAGAGANWCTFATWASKQAGQTIRKEDLRAALRGRMESSPEIAALLAAASAALRQMGIPPAAAAVTDAVLRALEGEAAFERAARAVAEGNLKVFEEIALQFALFLDVIARGNDDAAFALFVAAMRPGEPPAGQALLRAAFAVYRAALREQDAAARAQLLFHANLLIGLHEQTRLQPQIVAALNAGFDTDAVRRRVLQAVLPGAWRVLRYRIAAWLGRRPPLDEVLDRLLPLVQRELRSVITAQAMSLRLPAGVVVRLGDDVSGAFSPSLAALTNPQLLALLRRIDPTPDSVRDSGATDWGDLPERMHLITDLFRCRHDWPPLFEAPFSAAQLEALQAGRRPPDPL